MWTLQSGAKLIRILQPYTRKFGYHLALGGGVLNKGESEKDLDLYFLPMGGFDKHKAENKPDELLAFLDGIWGAHTKIDVYNYGHVEAIYKHSVKYNRIGGVNRDVSQRIDCFIF